jgi:hypothetical protein
MTDDQIKEATAPRQWRLLPGRADFARAWGEMNDWVMRGLGVPADFFRGDQHYPEAPKEGGDGG